MHNVRVGYGELRQRALAVAAGPQQQIVKSGDCVAVLLPRGIEQVIAVLGIMAVGAAYLPVNIDHPAVSQALLCHKAQVHVAIGERPAIEGVEAYPFEQLACAELLAAPVLPDPANLAYIIFTSGSTGEPKGVEIEHRSASNTVNDICQRYGIRSKDVLLGVAALDF